MIDNVIKIISHAQHYYTTGESIPTELSRCFDILVEQLDEIDIVYLLFSLEKEYAVNIMDYITQTLQNKYRFSLPNLIQHIADFDINHI